MASQRRSHGAEFGAFMDLTTPMRMAGALPPDDAMDVVDSTTTTGGYQHHHQHVQQQAQEMDMMGGGGGNFAKPKLSSSTSTIYVRNSLPANPDSAEVLSAIASVLQVIMSQAHTGNDVAPPIDMNLAVFDERTYVSKEMRKRLRWGNFSFRGHAKVATTTTSGRASGAHMPSDDPRQEGVPPKEVILEFLALASKRASFSAETTIIALILINRLLTTSSYQVHTFNWRLLWLSALLLAQKLQDDVSLDNASFPIVWRYATRIESDTLTVAHFNEMESKFLEVLNFSIFISRSLFAQFLFELRTLYEAEQPTLAFPLQPLSPEMAARLEFQTSQSRANDLKKRHEAGKSGMEGTQGFTLGVASSGGRGRHVLS